MERSSLERVTQSLAPEGPLNPIWYAFVSGLLSLALGFGYMLALALETHWFR